MLEVFKQNYDKLKLLIETLWRSMSIKNVFKIVAFLFSEYFIDINIYAESIVR